MSNIIKDTIISLLIISFLALTVTVNASNVNINKQQPEQTKVEAAFPVWLVILAVAYVIVEFGQGQYSSTTTTKPDGSTVTSVVCSGIGNCSITVKAESSYMPVSSPDYNESPDYTINGFLAVLEDGRVIFGIDEKETDYKLAKQFFYGNEITISRPAVIDDLKFLNELGLKSEIHIKGDYPVFQEGSVKYIILK
jgi:hypothetical protein